MTGASQPDPPHSPAGARGDADASATTRRHGLVALAAFTLSLVVALLGMWAGGPAGGAAFAGGLVMLLWAVAFFYAVRAWRELGRVGDPTSMTRVLGHLPIIVMVATILALALATITAGAQSVISHQLSVISYQSSVRLPPEVGFRLKARPEPTSTEN